jgi:hypothetical protein
MPDSNIVKSQKETYFKMIANSVGTKLFSSFIVKFKDTGKIKDVFRNGQLSCASFVSSILFLNGYIDSSHATVKSTKEHLLKFGWKKISNNNPKLGDVVIWDKMDFGKGQINEHIGFVLNKNQAISTSWIKRKTVKHHITFGKNNDGGPKRKIIGIYRFIH